MITWRNWGQHALHYLKRVITDGLSAGRSSTMPANKSPKLSRNTHLHVSHKNKSYLVDTLFIHLFLSQMSYLLQSSLRWTSVCLWGFEYWWMPSTCAWWGEQLRSLWAKPRGAINSFYVYCIQHATSIHRRGMKRWVLEWYWGWTQTSEAKWNKVTVWLTVTGTCGLCFQLWDRQLLEKTTIVRAAWPF